MVFAERAALAALDAAAALTLGAALRGTSATRLLVSVSTSGAGFTRTFMTTSAPRTRTPFTHWRMRTMAKFGDTGSRRETAAQSSRKSEDNPSAALTTLLSSADRA